MTKSNQLLVLLLVCCISKQDCFSQKSHSTIRPWKAIVYLTTDAKLKGTFYNITDSTVIIQGLGIKPDEIKLVDIRKIRIVPDYGKGGRKVVGFLVGATAGAIIVSEALSNGKSGEPATIGGVTGGIGGGFVGGLFGFFAWPGIFNAAATKKFNIKHDAQYYLSLKEKLQPFTIRGQ